MKKSGWKTILQVIVSVLTAAITEDYLAGYRQCADGCHHRTGNHQLHGTRTGDI